MKHFNLDMNRFLRELETIVNIDSGTSDLEGCREAARFYMERMEAAGLECEMRTSDTADVHPILAATSPCCKIPRKIGRPYDVLLMGHMDTVFPKGTAEQRAFRLEYEDGRPIRAHGPGTVDMKAGALLMIYIAEYLAEHHPDLRVCILLNSDEETGSAESAEEVFRLGYEAEAAFVFEGGRKQDQFVSTRKGCNQYEIRVSGVAAHAGTAPRKGANAIVEMGHLVTALDKLKNYARGTSVNVGLIEGGTALNVVPDLCTAQVEVRYTDPKELARVQRAIDKLTGKPPKVEGTSVEITLLAATPPLTETAETQKMKEKMRAYGPQYAADLQKLKDSDALPADTPVFPVEFVAAGGLSDANRLASCGIPVIDGCGPGGGNPHRPDEFLTIDTVMKRFVYFTGLLPMLKQM